MGIPTAIASRNGERSELKHLSRSRKRTQTAIPSVTASERGPAQTESARTCGAGLTISVRPVPRSLLKRSAIQGDSPVSGRSTT